MTGAIGKTADGKYIKLNATKGVILCAGDYMNNISMLKRYNGDTLDLYPDVENQTGDGHILGTLAGGRIAPAPHSRQIHSAWSTDGLLLDTPLLALDTAGKRFMNEECVMTSGIRSSSTTTRSMRPSSSTASSTPPSRRSTPGPPRSRTWGAS